MLRFETTVKINKNTLLGDTITTGSLYEHIHGEATNAFNKIVKENQVAGIVANDFILIKKRGRIEVEVHVQVDTYNGNESYMGDHYGLITIEKVL